MFTGQVHPNIRTQYNTNIMETMLIDLHFLTYSNYTVCTYSSNIGRLIYELKQTIPPYTADNYTISVEYPSDVGYMWYGYMDWFFYLYYVTTADNSNVSSIDKRKVIRYRSGQLVEYNGTDCISKENGIILYYIRTKYNNRPGDKEGYVLKKHLTKWPGRPKYYFYPGT